VSQFPAVLELADIDGTNGFTFNAGGVSAAALSSAGDVNGDGLADIMIGQADVNHPVGATFVLFGSAAGFASVVDASSLDGNNGFAIHGEQAGDFSGFSVSTAGDINGDGVADMIIGAPFTASNGSYSGASYVVFGSNAGFGAELDLTNLDGVNGFKVVGAGAYNYSGWSVSDAGDINGDGIDDIVVGAIGSESSAGASYVVFGSEDGFVPILQLSDLDGNTGFKFVGAQEYDYSGWSVSSAGDINGDGFGDVAIGAKYAGESDYYSGPAGATYIVYGTGAGFAPELNASDLDGTNGFAINGAGEFDYSGLSIDHAGDVNGDGIDDIVIGAEDINFDESGSAYVVFGRSDGFGSDMNLADLDGTNGFRIHSMDSFTAFGFAVGSAGDINGDGFDDVIVGAYQARPNGDYSGAAYVIFGKAEGFDANFSVEALDGENGFTIAGAERFDWSGRAVALAGDVNGDGLDDLMLSRGPWGDEGATYVVFGKLPEEGTNRTGTVSSQNLVDGDRQGVLSGLGGNDHLFGNGRADHLKGGSGNDVLQGGLGRDMLSGGRGADTFVYTGAADSTGRGFDVVRGADLSLDLWNVPATITAIDAEVSPHMLSRTHFNAQLGDILDGHLGAHHAVQLTPEAGRYAGDAFLVVDLNGVAGYQSGVDLVIELKAPVNLANIDAGDFI
jgi:hypothetical protein